MACMFSDADELLYKSEKEMKILLHIGQSKTGTSAIQKFLTLNKVKLCEVGVLYPSVKLGGVTVDIGAHNSVADALTGMYRYPFYTDVQYFNKFFKEAKDVKAETIILSAEHFFGGEPRVWNVTCENDYLKLYSEKIQRLASFLTDHDITILVYLRPQIDWLASAISHTIRIDGLISNKRTYESDIKYFEMAKPILKYSALLNIWADTIKPSSFIVVPYSKKQLMGGSSVSDFLYRAGLSGFKFSFGDMQMQANKSIAVDFLEVKKVLNRLPRSRHTERAYISCLERLSMSSKFGSEYVLDNILQRDAESFVAEDNAILSKLYGKGNWTFTHKTSRSAKINKPLEADDIKKAFQLFEKEIRHPRYKLVWLRSVIGVFLRNHARPINAVLHQIKTAYLRLASFESKG